MGRLYADEQFPYEVVEHLRNFGHLVYQLLPYISQAR